AGVPFGSDRLTVQGDADEDAINAYASGAFGVGVYAESAGGDAVVGIGASNGLFGIGGLGVFGIGVDGVQGNAISTTGTGLIGAGNDGDAYVLNTGSGASASGDSGVYAKSITVLDGVGLIGLGNNNSTNIVVPGEGAGVAGSSTRLGVFGYAGNGGVANGNRGNAAGKFILDADNNS